MRWQQVNPHEHDCRDDTGRLVGLVLKSQVVYGWDWWLPCLLVRGHADSKEEAMAAVEEAVRAG